MSIDNGFGTTLHAQAGCCTSRRMCAYILFTFWLMIAAATTGCSMLYDQVGGAFHGEPWQLELGLSRHATQLVNDAFKDIDPERFADYHVHMFTHDIPPDWLARWKPISYARTRVYFSAADVTWNDDFEAQYVARLLELITWMPVQPRCYLYAMDRYYHPDGRMDIERTGFHVSNETVLQLAAMFPEIFVPVVSIHPYRIDAIEELERCHRRGSRHVKWLPNTMNINPASKRIDRFYQRMHELDMVLLTHTGSERAVKDVLPELGNPLLLRRPLEMGVKIVALHAASAGLYVDLESPNQEQVSGFTLLLRLLEEPRYEGLLFAETSAMTFEGHIGEPLLTLLERDDLQKRFVNGSDYPFAAVNWALRTSTLAAMGLITPAERDALDEIYNYNPLLFDFVVKRTIRHPKTGQRLSAELFMAPEAIR